MHKRISLWTPPESPHGANFLTVPSRTLAEPVWTVWNICRGSVVASCLGIVRVPLGDTNRSALLSYYHSGTIPNGVLTGSSGITGGFPQEAGLVGFR